MHSFDSFFFTSSATSLGNSNWEKYISRSINRASPSGLTIPPLVPLGFIGAHVSPALKCHGDGVLGLDNFNCYYNPNLKRAQQFLPKRAGVFVVVVFIVNSDINNAALLHKLFNIVPIIHLAHLALLHNVEPLVVGTHTRDERNGGEEKERVLVDC
ncbi:hypothetical protein PIB30_005714 [Stylosanthes scabra]|uniref:Uncharacterized protein n=1 Tax=Stylosanthes scabra TaxID=79078 RepID=A0ABU6V2T3_9FABA|nr:hypothetical protein [Stylosanthes scabra]